MSFCRNPKGLEMTAEAAEQRELRRRVHPQTSDVRLNEPAFIILRKSSGLLLGHTLAKTEHGAWSRFMEWGWTRGKYPGGSAYIQPPQRGGYVCVAVEVSGE